MRRFSIIILLVLGLALAASVLVAQIATQAGEIQEINSPALTPSVTTPNIPTFVTFTSVLPDTTVYRPTLQFFDPMTGKWHTVGRLRDDGKLGDSTKKDRTFTLRVRLLDSGSTAEISVLFRRKLKLKGRVSSPPEFRLSARRKGLRGILVSPPLFVSAVTASSIVIGGESTGPEVSVKVPPTFDVIDASDSAHVVFKKTGPEGYQLDAFVKVKPSSLPLESWVFANAFGFTEPGEPTSFEEYPAAEVELIQAGGLSGIVVTRQELQKEVAVFLDDPTHSRLFWFRIFGRHEGQDANLDDNLTEALSIVQSLQR